MIRAVYYRTFQYSLPKCSLRVHCIPEGNYDTGCMLQATSVFLTEMSCTCIAVGNYETGCMYITGHFSIPFQMPCTCTLNSDGEL